ncbi:GxxExxY protein [Flavobacterium algicola]|uniref:GxxExxY protein n=1 Tax=Flavobacterium algicola TaxID=556529 RepID=UPI001EFD11C8|nr:GxxExxY protein [Flavobacterium algicola]MCG9791419.1 GxxExxY protein [Flavobacterium algicola]
MEVENDNFELGEELNALTYKVIGLAIEVHRNLGPGLLESAYQACLLYELKKAGFKVEKEIPLPIKYKEIKLEQGYRIDLLIENKLVIELKTVEEFTSVHYAQILTYLKLGNYPLGLLINFNSKILKNNIKRFINSNKEV